MAFYIELDTIKIGMVFKSFEIKISTENIFLQLENKVELGIVAGTMADSLMYIPNNDKQNSPSVDYILQLLIETCRQNSIKVPKVVKTTNNETLLKTFDTSYNQPNVSSLPVIVVSRH